MNQTNSPEAQDIARRLVAYEAGAGSAPGANTPAAFRVSEKLRRPLSTLAGATGFRALLARALMLAKREDHSLSAVCVKPDGSLEGLKEPNDDDAEEPGVALIAQLLRLLVAFIGEALTTRLVQDIWSDLSFNLTNPGEANRHDPTR
ncbi:MAG TPA: hypothetical protein VN737_19730 [Bryobacteraceae bacterium]|jgi:hypothetical protein|nr:hypothetical protein [Bryobacteraceae bacterium]